jgi:succinyl-CoA synthetase beta subunit
MDNTLTNIANSLRLIMEQIANLGVTVNGQGNGLAYLENVVGYSNTGDPANPGGISDAAWAQQVVNDLLILQQVYAGVLGTAVVGQSAVALNFNSVFAPLWGGRID